MYELLAAGNDLEAAESVARSLGGVCYLGDPDEQRELPFRTLVRCVTDTPQSLAPAATVGLYLGFCRVIRERPTTSESGSSSPGVTAIFPLLHHPDLTHEQSDAHWRDVHAPLALRHHPGMWDYTQLSVVKTLSGLEVDGFALVSFESTASMKERFLETTTTEKSYIKTLQSSLTRNLLDELSPLRQFLARVPLARQLPGPKGDQNRSVSHSGRCDCSISGLRSLYLLGPVHRDSR